jgi:hypothetical protein
MQLLLGMPLLLLLLQATTGGRARWRDAQLPKPRRCHRCCSSRLLLLWLLLIWRGAYRRGWASKRRDGLHLAVWQSGRVQRRDC